MWKLLAIFCFIVQARATGWDDFTNNLATDLAPLVALFGEQATKQFLSESTSRLDNIIFAVAPLGILTAVVSVIRVLGSASLRAFVGRAQEGRGLAEAELCSSTSYDVCELWNNGGITRVFGRPQILEFIFDEEEMERGEKQEDKKHGKSQETETSHWINPVFYESFSGDKVRRPTAGIYKPQEYVKMLPPGYERTPPLARVAHHKRSDDARIEFAPNPNLSLNVGIQKPNTIVLCGAAAFGCFLQASVLGYGAWATYIKGLRKEDQSTTYPYFWLTFTGTLLLVTGMFLCAWLIEQSTQERRFKLGKQVFWLQPGNQRVGDQNFEAFAYSTKLKEYTTSWKNEDENGNNWRKGAFMRLAISTSMAGFILQFTGLRGLHSSVAMYQFVATLVMALVRSLLRTQRLKESENLLRGRELQSQVEGHELDWQTLKIGNNIQEAAKAGRSNSTDPHTNPPSDKSSGDETYWLILEEPHKLGDERIRELEKSFVSQLKIDYNTSFAVNKNGSAAWTSCHETGAGNQDEWDGKCANAIVKWIATLENQEPHQISPSPSPNDAKKLLCYRSRFSYLTNDGAPTTDQRWSSSVREQAVKLQAAIQSVANYVFSDACQATVVWDLGNTAAFCWALNCYTGPRCARMTAFPVHLMVRRVRGQWRIDICQLEAVLGLWVQSIKTEVNKIKEGEERRKNDEVETEEKKWNKGAKIGERAERDQSGKGADKESYDKKEIDYDSILSRKIFAVVPNSDSEARKRAERELNIWVLREKRQPVYDTLDDQVLKRSKTVKQESRSLPSPSLPVTRKLLFRSNPEHQQNQQWQDKGLLSVQTESSVLVMATQDIFTSFIDALASGTSELEGVNIVQSLRSNALADEEISTARIRPFLGLAHAHTTRLADLFTQAGLGSQEDALMSVIPPFRSRSLLPSLMKEYKALNSQARKLIGEGRWEQAENLLIALHDEANSRNGDTPHQSEDLFRELGELYRKAMRSADQSRRQFGYRGVCKMLDMCAERTESTINIKHNYSWVALELAKLHKDDLDAMRAQLQAGVKNDKIPYGAGTTLQDAMKFRSAYPIGLLMVERFKKQIKKKDISTEPPLLIWAAQKGCKELVEDLLDEGLDVNILDKQHRTPLSYACEKGYKDLSKQLLGANATLIADQNNHTPFTWAVKKGRSDVAQLFIGMNIDFNSKDLEDGRTPLSWAAEGGHEAVVELLLKTGKVNADLKDSVGRTPLLWATLYGHEAVVKLLLGTDKVDVNSKDEEGLTSLWWAAKGRHEAVVKLLLETGNVDVNSKDSFGQTLLSWAAEGGHGAVVELLLKTGKVNVDLKDSVGRTPLLWAALYGHEAVVKLLLEAGNVDVNLKDSGGQTPLWRAARGGHKAVVKLLLEIDKVDVNSKGLDGETPLSWAAASGHEAVVKLLLEAGNVDVNSKDSFGQTLLSWAAEGGHEAVVELLLETDKVNVNIEDENERTPLSWAAGGGHEAVVKLLLETDKVDVNSRDSEYGRTPLSWAAEGGHEAVVKLLLETDKVSVDLEDEKKRTPLSWAAGGGQEAVVKLLLGTDKVKVNFEDEEERTPLSWAAGGGHEAVVKLLLQMDKIEVDSSWDSNGWTPLLWALDGGHEAVAELLRSHVNLSQ